MEPQTENRRSERITTIILSFAMSAALAALFLPAAGIMCELTKTPFPVRYYVIYWCAFAIMTAFGSYAIEAVERYLPPLSTTKPASSEAP